jgi:hypothetical protein
MAEPNTAPATQTAAPAAQAQQPAATQAVAAPAQSAQPSAAQVIPPALAAMLPPAAAAQGAAAQTAAQVAQTPTQPAPLAQPTAAEPSKKSADEQVSELRQQLTARTVREHVVSVATEAGAINPEQVHKLLADELDALPDGRVIVKGDPRANAKEHVAKYLAGNLHMLKPTVPGGGAGTPAAVGAPAAGATLDPKTLEGGTQVVRGFMGRLFTTPAPATGGAAGAR